MLKKFCPQHPQNPLYNKDGCIWSARSKYKNPINKSSINNQNNNIKRISPVSEKRAAELEVYSFLRIAFLKYKPFCEANICCSKGTPSTEIHHKKGREGKLLLLVKYGLSTCRNCHDYITENSAEAIENNLSISRNKIR